MPHSLEGIVKVKKEVQMLGSKGFCKQEFVITDDKNPKYPQDIALECQADKIALLKEIDVGDRVVVTFDIRGREHNGRYYNTLLCYSVAVKYKGEGGGIVNDEPAVDNEDDDLLF